MQSPVAKVLQEMSELAEAKFQTYGNTYEQVGELMKILYPHGVYLETAADIAFYSILTWVLGKLCRYATSLDPAARLDSLKDMTVYAAMAYTLYKKVQEEETKDAK